MQRLVLENRQLQRVLTAHERAVLRLPRLDSIRLRCSHCERQTMDQGALSGYSGAHGISEDYEWVCATCGHTVVQ